MFTQVIIMGDGAFGSAIMYVLKKNRVKARYWKKGEKLPSKSLVIGAIPTQFIRETLAPSRGARDITYLNCAKGIENETHKLPYQIVTELLEKPEYLTLMGPSFAEEIKKEMPTLVNIGYRSKERAEKVKQMLQTDFFRIKLTKSIRSLEISAAFKNIYAICCGVTSGLGLGMNTRVKIMLLALFEFQKLIKKLNFKMDGKALPATVGDLILTCSSSESRNFTFGTYLCDNSVAKSLEKAGGTVEGFYTAASVPYFEKETGVQLPLARFIYELCYATDSKNIKKKFTEFVKTT